MALVATISCAMRGGRGFDFDDHGMIRINQVVVAVTELASPLLRIPRRCGIGRREIPCLALMRRATGIKGFPILPHGPGCRFSGTNLVPTFDSSLTPGIAADQAAVHGEALAAHQPSPPALTDDLLE